MIKNQLIHEFMTVGCTRTDRKKPSPESVEAYISGIISALPAFYARFYKYLPHKFFRDLLSYRFGIDGEVLHSHKETVYFLAERQYEADGFYETDPLRTALREERSCHHPDFVEQFSEKDLLGSVNPDFEDLLLAFLNRPSKDYIEYCENLPENEVLWGLSPEEWISWTEFLLARLLHKRFDRETKLVSLVELDDDIGPDFESDDEPESKRCTDDAAHEVTAEEQKAAEEWHRKALREMYKSDFFPLRAGIFDGLGCTGSFWKIDEELQKIKFYEFHDYVVREDWNGDKWIIHWWREEPMPEEIPDELSGIDYDSFMRSKKAEEKSRRKKQEK